MNNGTILEKEVNGYKVIITFRKEKNQKLKENILWCLIKCYEDRIEKIIESTASQ